jgi:hypothetical protein
MDERRISEEEVPCMFTGWIYLPESYDKRVAEDVFEGGRALRVVYLHNPGSNTVARIFRATDLEQVQR